MMMMMMTMMLMMMMMMSWRGGIMMRVECVQCQQRQACPTPPEGPRLADSYDVLLEKTSELRHVQQIVYIVEKRKTHKKLNFTVSDCFNAPKIVKNCCKQIATTLSIK